MTNPRSKGQKQKTALCRPGSLAEAGQVIRKAQEMTDDQRWSEELGRQAGGQAGKINEAVQRSERSGQSSGLSGHN